MPIQSLKELIKTFPPDMEFGVLLLLADGTPALHVRAPLNVESFGKVPVEYGYFELHRYEPEGFVVYFRFLFFDQADPYEIQTFLNPCSEPDRAVLLALSKANMLAISLHSMLDDGLSAIGVRWSEAHRREIQLVLERTAGQSNPAWPAAKERWLAEHPQQSE